MTDDLMLAIGNATIGVDKMPLGFALSTGECQQIADQLRASWLAEHDREVERNTREAVAAEIVASRVQMGGYLGIGEVVEFVRARSRDLHGWSDPYPFEDEAGGRHETNAWSFPTIYKPRTRQEYDRASAGDPSPATQDPDRETRYAEYDAKNANGSLGPRSARRPDRNRGVA